MKFDTPDLASTGERFSFNTRWCVCVAFAIVALGITCSTSGVFAIEITIGLLADGTLLGLLIASAAGWAAWPTAWLTRGAFPSGRERDGRDHLLPSVTAIAVGLGFFSLTTLGFGLLGLLGRTILMTQVIAGIALLAAFLGRVRANRVIAGWLRARSGGNWAWLTLAPAAGLLILAASLMPGLLWRPLDPHPYDVLGYHLQIPREWYELGKIVPLKHNAFSFFPLVYETQALLLMHLAGGPWKAMYAAQFLNVIYVALTTAAVFSVVRRAGGGRTGAFAAAMIAGTVPWTLMLGSVAYVEAPLMLFTTLAVGWALPRGRADDPTDIRRFILVGLLAGCAAGTKYTAVPMVAGMLGFAVAAGVVARRGQALKQALIVVVVAAVVFAPWALRDIAWTGNPVFPLATKIFGKAHFTDDQVERYRIAHAPPPALRPLGPRLSAAVGRTFGDWQSGFVLPAASCAAAAYLCWRGGRAGRIVVIVLLGNVLLWFFATHVIPRFLAHVIPIAAIAVGLALGNLHQRLATRRRQAIFAFATYGLSMLVAVMQTGHVAIAFNSFVPNASAGLWRLDDVSRLEAPDLETLRDSDTPLALIGDPQPFLHVTDSKRTLYRTVFDVNLTPGIDAADGWLGIDVATLRRDHAVVVSGMELQRLSKTYYKITSPDPKWLRGEGPVVLPPLRR